MVYREIPDDEETRNRLWRHALLALVIIVIPVLYSAVTAEVALERSKSLQFCASCHVMTPYVEGLKAPDSELLAAKHYQYRRINHNQCYTCHADYDMFGPAKAKANGLKHMIHYYFAPPRKIALYKPFPNSHCLQCHDGARSFVKAESHKEIIEALRSDEMKCFDCHGPVHPSHVEKGK
ncbi:MAG: NapC/NirT family cytochrome c [Elusimicrobia bacterium]|nr:NapC/NirT family cytochrome c [Elusimicrobiota bacterium]